MYKVIDHSYAVLHFRDSAMVQLSVLLCLIPLALENAMMQAHITQECLTLIVSALDRHRSEVDIQTKGLVLLGVLIQVGSISHLYQNLQWVPGVRIQNNTCCRTVCWSVVGPRYESLMADQCISWPLNS